MGTKKAEIARRLRRAMDGDRAAEALKTRNEALRRLLTDIPIPGARADGLPGAGLKGDTVGAEAIRRAEISAEIRKNNAEIARITCECAEMERLLFSALTAEERGVLLARYGKGLSWTEVARELHISRSSCFRLEAEGLRKLCECQQSERQRSDCKRGRDT